MDSAQPLDVTADQGEEQVEQSQHPQDPHDVIVLLTVR